MKKRKNIIIAIVLLIIILLLGLGVWFVVDKLNRIDYTTESTEQQIEEVVDESIPEESVVTEEEPEEEEIILVSEEEMSALGLTEAKITDMDIFSDSDVFNVLLLGTDERKHNFSTNARADSIMILSIDKEN